MRRLQQRERPRQAEAGHLIRLGPTPHGLRHPRENEPGRKSIKTSLPPGACSVMASCAGGGSVLEELFWRERERDKERGRESERERAPGHFFRWGAASCHYTHLSGSNEMSGVNCDTARRVALPPQAPYLSPQMRKTAFSRGP